MRWSKVSLEQFQFINAINEDSSFDALDKILHTTCMLFGYTERTLSALPLRKVRKLMRKTEKLFSLSFSVRRCNRIGKYFIDYQLDSIRFGQYIELNYFFQQDTIENAHRILASLAHPLFRKNDSSRHAEVAEYILREPINKIIGSLQSAQESFKALTEEYKGLFGLDEDSEPTDQVEFTEHPFNKNYGWIYSATQVAEHEGITLEQAFNLPIRQALNDLSYLKAKRSYDEEQIRKQHGRTKH